MRSALGVLWLALAGLAWAGEPASPAKAAGAPDVRVLLYHRVGDPRHPSTDVSAEAFRAQMAWLRDGGYTVVPTALLEAFLLRGEPLPPRAVAIHFDDGYRSVFENALPVLREFGYPFAVFLPTEAVDRGYPDYLTWAMVRGLAEAGAEFGAHGHRHLRLGAPEPGEPPARWRARIAAELGEGARRLEAEGLAARWVAYPYGEYGPEVLEEAAAAGFALGFSQDPGAVGPGTDPLRVPRFAVVGTLAELTAFRERFEYLPLALDDLEPPPGRLPEGPVERVSARVAEAMGYRAGEANVFLSELGRLEARFEPVSGRVFAPVGSPLARRVNRVVVSLRDAATGRYAVGSWLLLNPEGGR